MSCYFAFLNKISETLYGGSLFLDPLYSPPLPGMTGCGGGWLAFRRGVLVGGVGFRPVGVGVGATSKPWYRRGNVRRGSYCYVICTLYKFSTRPNGFVQNLAYWDFSIRSGDIPRNSPSFSLAAHVAKSLRRSPRSIDFPGGF